MVMNNDLTISVDWFSHMVKAINEVKNPKISSYFGLVLNKTGKQIESEGLEFFQRGKALNIGNGQPYTPSYSSSHSQPHYIWGASASVVIYVKRHIEQAGVFDPLFFAYEEDVDMALRLNQLGYQTLFVPKAISFHLGGGTSRHMGNFRHIMDAKNWIIIILKNYSIAQIIKHLPQIIEERFRNLSGLIKNTPFFQIPSSLFRAYSPIIINLPIILKKRKDLQKLIQSTHNDHRY